MAFIQLGQCVSTDGSIVSAGYFHTSAAVYTSVPMTMMVDCVIEANAGAICNLMQQTNITATYNGFILVFNDTQGLAKAETASNAVFGISSGVPITRAKRSCVIGVWRSTSHRQCWVNGVPDTANTTNLIPASTPDDLIIGASRHDLTQDNFSKLSTIYRAAVWKGALEADEIAALSRGAPFSNIRPTQLVEGWVIGDGSNLRGYNHAFNLAASGITGNSPPTFPRLKPFYRTSTNFVRATSWTMELPYPWSTPRTLRLRGIHANKTQAFVPGQEIAPIIPPIPPGTTEALTFPPWSEPQLLPRVRGVNPLRTGAQQDFITAGPKEIFVQGTWASVEINADLFSANIDNVILPRALYKVRASIVEIPAVRGAAAGIRGKKRLQ